MNIVASLALIAASLFLIYQQIQLGMALGWY